MKVIIDRFEGDFAVCEVINEGKMINLLKSRLPEQAKAGDVLILDESGVSVDPAETSQRQKEIADLLDSLWE